MCLRPACLASALKQPSSKGRGLRLRGRLLTLTTTSRGKVSSETYCLSETGSDIGRGFILLKVSGDSACYTTHVGGTGLVHCDCDGFQKGGYCCKHIAAVAKLLETGLIPGGIPG